ncbi:DHS-like NAD/FAD-binding domain-containing protein [Athelia psychrophila]|uniref:DHS-like NAD/FAD-binding domain-containing protein n=1 Tax=Athelia psychrophila TaxID=1759441 RepID=A0A166HYF3_9AGAM|nr:DHS-like NAD/FAD-binding domain-containing protein [Fibularhizoctonia sp. CBS 109695]
MRISVPTIPLAILSNATTTKVITPFDATNRIATFLGAGNTTVITGAGVSVDSGIRAYRGDDGRYMNPNYKPIFYHELVDETEKGYAFRQRYWLRSYLGYPPVRDALPNTTHTALAALQHTSVVSKLITQNVDGLHFKAISHLWDSSKMDASILELHGTLHKVRCRRGHVVDRDMFQKLLSDANPQWKQFVDDMESTGNQPRTNPDGDVAIEGVSYDDFVVPECPSCWEENHRNSNHKPEVIFFGESIPKAVKDRSLLHVEQCDRLLIIGTTLATYSAFSLLKRALELKKPVLLLNVGPTRADLLPNIDKIDMSSGVIIRDVVKQVLGTTASTNVAVRDLLSKGIVKPPTEDDDRAPRAAG